MRHSGGCCRKRGCEMGKKLNEKNLVFSFKIAYLLMLMMGNTNLTFQMRIYDLLNYAVGFFGIALLLLRLLRAKSYLKTPGIWLLAGLIGLYAVSSVLNYSYGGMSGFVSNGKATVWMACQMLLLYAFDTPSPEELKKEFRVMCWVILVFNFLSVLISYGMLIVNYSYLYIGDGTSIMSGVVWNRLWGTFIDPNYGAVEAVVAILISVYFFREQKNIWLRVLFVANIVLSVMYVVYSDSRTGMVVLAIAIVAYTFLAMFYTGKKVRRGVVSLLICGAVAVCFALGVLGSFGAVKTVGLLPREAYVQLQNNWSQNADPTEDTDDPTEDTDASETEDPDAETVTQPTEDALEIGRSEENLDTGASNRRLAIWMSGLEVAMKSPFFGTTFRNLVPFAYQEAPYTYIIYNEDKVFWDFHNCFVNVLACQGIPALILFLAFVVIVLKKTITYLLKNPGTMRKEQVLLVSVLATIAGGAMFNSMIMYVSSIETAIFWIFLGYCMQICHLEEKANA